MKLNEGLTQETYKIKKINLDDEELKSFLFSLGCYEGENITIISNKKRTLTIVIKDSRYSIDSQMAKEIEVEKI